MPALFSELLSPDGTRLLDGAWPRQVFVTHGLPERLPRVLSGPEVSLEYLQARFQEPARVSLRDVESIMLRPASEAVAWRQRGATVVLYGIGKYVETLFRFERELEHELGLQFGCAQTGLFCSPAGEGYAPHFDGSDVFSVQLRGEKTFFISTDNPLQMPYGGAYTEHCTLDADMYPQVARSRPDVVTSGLTRITMRPGTVLYLPRGTWHSTQAVSDSVSVSIAMHPPMGLEYVLEQFRAVLMQDARWREPLYGIGGTGAQQSAVVARLAALIADLPRAASVLDPALLVAHAQPVGERFAAIGDTSRFYRLPQMVFLPAEDSVAGTLRVRDVGAPASVRPVELAAPEGTAAVCEWIASSRCSFSVRELRERFPATGQDAVLTLLRTLVTSGVLRLLWFPMQAPSPRDAN